jgi:hypothetical protein
MQHNSWLRPSLADGWSSGASDTAAGLDTAASSSFAVPRARVALGAVAPATSGPSAAVALGSVGTEVWGDVNRAAHATARVAPVRHAAQAAGAAPKAALTPFGAPARQAVRAASTAAGGTRGGEPMQSAGPRARPRLFEFIGHGALSVTSSITGKHYRFTEHGAQLPVDPRDWSQLSRVPSLRAVVV